MNCRMGTQIQMVAHEEIEESFLTQVRLWANEVFWERQRFRLRLLFCA